ncbi:MAG: alpha/beta fold hydrolase [Saprospiraceae bacterium]|nr:alpha/beta fold hydrolase [Saprospiraceae bacterium]
MTKHLPLALMILASSVLGCTEMPVKNEIYDRLSWHRPGGFQDSLLVGTLEVFENRETQTGRMIPLFVAVTPALVRDSLQEPIFIIDGGPGIGVSHQAYFYTELDTTYRRYHDIVFVDARGTGRSSPLHCPALQSKRSPAEYFSHPFPQEELEACLEMYRDSVDLNFYQTKYLVEDLEEVRRWLGYDQINLLGISFGGKVALMYMDRHPSSIHRVVLHAPDGPNIDHLSMRGRSGQQALEVLFQYCREDPACHAQYPNLSQEFQALMARLQESDLTTEVAVDDSLQAVHLAWPPVAAKIVEMLYEDLSYIQIPFIIHEAYLENYQPLLEAMHVTSTDTNYFYADGMWLSNVCAEDVPQAIINYDAAETATFLGDYIYQTRRDACRYWPVTPADESAYASVVSDIPTLILSGQLDPVTPPETGAEIAGRLSQSRHIILPYMGHMIAALSNMGCYDTYVLSFLEGREDQASVDCFDEMKPMPFKVAAMQDGSE